MKKLFYLGLSALVCLGFQSCKKDKTNTPTKYTYENSRIKQLNIDGVKDTEYFYNNKNQLTSIKTYKTYDNLSITSYTEYEYNGDGTIKKHTTKKPDDLNYIANTEYSYKNGLLDVITNDKNAVNKIFYTYANNKLNQRRGENSAGVEIYTSSYDYSLSDGNPKVIENQNQNGSVNTYTTIYSPNVIDPDPLKLPGLPSLSNFVLKSREISYDSPLNTFTISYITDPNGKITSYTKTYKNGSITKYTYVYEAKQ
ncbi:MAG: hypothetical protein WBP45_08385 [Daejeonella sp.]